MQKGRRQVQRATKRPLSIAVLTGGQSRRMGTPKADLLLNHMTLLQRTVLVAMRHADRVVIIGSTADAHLNLSFSPPDDARVIYLQDAQQACGPMAGVLAAFDHDASCDWLVLACDMPCVSDNAIEWLMGFHRPDSIATIGLLPGGSEPEPMLAIYAPAAKSTFLASANAGRWSMKHAIREITASVVEVPVDLAPAWVNVNTQDEWAALLASKAG